MNTGCTVCNTGTIVTHERDGLRITQCNYCGDVVSMEPLTRSREDAKTQSPECISAASAVSCSNSSSGGAQ